MAWAAFPTPRLVSAVDDYTASLVGYCALDLLPSCGRRETLTALGR
jgi:hypothetical protein